MGMPFARTQIGPTWWLAGCLALVLHVVWIAGMPALSLPTPGAGSGTDGVSTIYFYENRTELPERLMNVDVRALRSPTIFSLPTPMGFSSSFLGERRSLKPPLGELDGSAGPEGMPEGALPPGPEPLEDPSTLVRGIEWSGRSTDVASDAFPAAETATGALLRITWIDRIRGLKNQTLSVEKGSVWDDPKPWEAIAYMEFDELGNARHVLLEKPTSSEERNEHIVRAMRAYHAKPGQLGQSGHVALRFSPGGQARAAKAKEQP